MGKIGAAVLAAKSCLKSGVGILSVHSPECGYDILQKSVPEAMVIKDDGENYIESIVYPHNYSLLSTGIIRGGLSNEKIEKPEVNPNEQEVSVKLIICSNILIYIYHSIADNL